MRRIIKRKSKLENGISQRAPCTEEDLFEILKREILFGILKPRERLVEMDLAERFNAGRYMIRATFDRLERAGLIQRRAKRGVIVRDYQTDEVDELYVMREILQREAVLRINFADKEELAKDLNEINKEYSSSLSKGDLSRVADANDRFHRILFGACGNRFLIQSIEEYWLKTAAIHCYAIGVPNLAKQSLEEHERMIEAILNEDCETLVQLCTDHMKPALSAYKAAHGGWGA